MRRTIATICLVFVCSTSAFSSGFSIYEASIRANGMLGAFAAYADHVSTIYYNPAGLSGLDGLRISGGATIIAPRSSFRGPFASSSAYPGSSKRYDMHEQNFLVPNFYASYEIQDGLTAGIGVYAPFGLGTRWDKNWVGRTEAINTSVETIFVQPTVGYQLPDFGIGNVKIGAGLVIAAYGKVELSRAVEDFAVEDDIFALDGELEKPGLGYNLGLLYEPTDRVTLGFTYRSKVETEYSGEADFGDLPTALFPSDAGGGTTLELPANWVAAVNVQATENLNLEADYVWWGWSSYDELVIEFDQQIPAFGSDRLASERGYDNSWQLRVGGEYTDAWTPGLSLRAGVAYDKSPLPTKYMDPTLPDANRWLFSGGLSYDVTEYLTVDASYIFIRSNERTNRSSVNGLHGVYNTHANLPSLGLTMKF
ncbi:OmpP1/FadL family transporter [Fodinibius sediminis]|uniref:Long-chain fatty acid transport protein n=1 Tax=Fodinibius sediminis TaxID=1214077 RepID=A0A521D5B6_9BACT|nr:OmpP1/FadL family transporter [Fodinibius sediminis]SMO66080.1 long-chain fatty acid transport protein [Fodinibius sediminis]